MDPQHAITYNNSNTNKKVIYRTLVTNNHPQVAALGSFNQLINSGIVHPTGVPIVPFLAPVTGTSGGLGDSQWNSPFHICPCTTSKFYGYSQKAQEFRYKVMNMKVSKKSDENKFFYVFV
jgi:hypothetical protein